MSLESEYRRGYEDGLDGRDPSEPTRPGALNEFLDGLFGSRSEDEVRDAYIRGYHDGCQRRATYKRVVGV